MRQMANITIILLATFVISGCVNQHSGNKGYSTIVSEDYRSATLPGVAPYDLGKSVEERTNYTAWLLSHDKLINGYSKEVSRQTREFLQFYCGSNRSQWRCSEEKAHFLNVIRQAQIRDEHFCNYGSRCWEAKNNKIQKDKMNKACREGFAAADWANKEGIDAKNICRWSYAR